MKKYKKECEKVYKQLKERGFKLTGPRKLVIECLNSANKHLTVEEIYNFIKKRDSKIGMTSVYRSLDLLEHINIIYKFICLDKRSRYELIKCSPEGHHHHLVCSSCCKIIDYYDFAKEELRLIKRIEKNLAQNYDFSINNHILQFIGICPKCKKKIRKN